MKNYKYIGLVLLSLAFFSCDIDNTLEAIPEVVAEEVALNAGGLDFSNYIAVGASFSAGYTDGAVFRAGQENSFPNILATKFKAAGGGDFIQPLMNDNIGGLVFNGTVIASPRLYFDGAGPAVLNAIPTTEITNILSGAFNNFGAPGAKSYHLGIPGYGQLNPYFGRMASSPTATILGDVLARNATFFTLSEIGGNDVLGYATSGGSGVDQTGNPNPLTYGNNDITDPNVFAQVFSSMVAALTANGAKGVVANIPDITSLPYFTTVPYNAVPLDVATATQLNAAYAAYNTGIQQAFGLLVASNLMSQADASAEIAKRTISFSQGQNAMVIIDENLTDLGAINPAFAALQQLRQTTPDDLPVLLSSSIIGTTVGGNPLLINGLTVPLADNWVLTPEEQLAIKTATDAYNTTIAAVTSGNPNVTMVDFKQLLQEASAGIAFDNYILTTNLVTGGLVSLDGVHLTARGYALMANRILAAMDAAFGSNFTQATNGLAVAGEYPTNYSPLLR